MALSKLSIYSIILVNLAIAWHITTQCAWSKYFLDILVDDLHMDQIIFGTHIITDTDSRFFSSRAVRTNRISDNFREISRTSSLVHSISSPLTPSEAQSILTSPPKMDSTQHIGLLLEVSWRLSVSYRNIWEVFSESIEIAQRLVLMGTRNHRAGRDRLGRNPPNSPQIITPRGSKVDDFEGLNMSPKTSALMPMKWANWVGSVTRAAGMFEAVSKVSV